MLYLVCQRYKFKSKLQHVPGDLTTRYRCIWCVKDTNSKANYNTLPHNNNNNNKLYLVCQRYKFKSKLQRSMADNYTLVRCIWCVKDTNSKANYNDCHLPSWSL